jgi:hypothetical protein
LYAGTMTLTSGTVLIAAVRSCPTTDPSPRPTLL